MVLCFEHGGVGGVGGGGTDEVVGCVDVLRGGGGGESEGLELGEERGEAGVERVSRRANNKEGIKCGE